MLVQPYHLIERPRMVRRTVGRSSSVLYAWWDGARRGRAMPSEQHKPHDPAILIWVPVGKRRRRTLLRSEALRRLTSFLTRSFTLRRRRLIGLRSRGSRCQISCLGRTRSGFCTRPLQPKRPLRRSRGTQARSTSRRDRQRCDDGCSTRCLMARLFGNPGSLASRRGRWAAVQKARASMEAITRRIGA